MVSDFPSWDIDPFAEAVLADPYDYFAELRDKGPVVWLEKYGVWASGRHQQVQAMFNDWQRFCSSRGVGLTDFQTEKPWRPRSLILEVDPPEHSRTRAVMTRVLSPRAVGALAETFRKEAEALVARLLDMGRFDGVREVAEAFPLKVFPDAVGIAPDGRETLLDYGAMVFNGLGPDNGPRQRAMARAPAVVPWIAERCQRHALSAGGFGAALYQAADAGDITEEEASLLVRSLLSAGVDTTVTGFGNALLCFARHPKQWRQLVEAPALARQAFEEVLRYESPIHSFFRTTACPVDVGGVALGEGRKVILVLAAANRDPRQWQDAETFDIDRRPAGHVAMGAGIHGCVGRAVALLEAEALLGAMAAKIETIDLAGEPAWRPGNAIHGLDSLPLHIRPR